MFDVSPTWHEFLTEQKHIGIRLTSSLYSLYELNSIVLDFLHERVTKVRQRI